MLVTGAAGLLGSEVVRAAEARGYAVLAAGRGDLDVTDREAVREMLLGAGEAGAGDAGSTNGAPPGFTDVVHCAAYTAVDHAEEEPELAARVNVDGTRHVAEAAAGAGARFVSVSTDYVFDGEARSPYAPDAPVAPLSVYGRTKLEGERVALASQPGALVIRTSWLYGAGGRNFVSAMVERGRERAGSAGGQVEPLRVVDDQRGRPTWARNTAEGLLDLLERRARGVWHVADGGEATWLELAREAYRLCGVPTPLDPVSTEEWGAPAPRPRYSVLDVAGTEALLGRPRIHWREALKRYLTEVGEI
jgi:dTDP-4-dehydrorhamnose reductase